MSEPVHYKGKLIKVERKEDGSLEEQCKRMLGDETLKPYYDSYEEQLLDWHHGKCIIYNGELYKVEKEDIYYNDIHEAYKNEDGTIDFEVKYYNGGQSFSEAINVALNELEG